MSKLLNERGAADFLKVAPDTLKSWRARCCGPKFIRLGTGKGSSIRYDLAELENFVDAGRVG